MKIKNYIDYLREQEEIPDKLDNDLSTDTPSEDITSNPSDAKTFDESTDAIREMIDKTIEKSGGEFETFKESFLKDPNEIKIEGLINDSDIYEFYLKYRNEIDEVLGDIKFYDEVPSELNVFGLYEYVTHGTMKAVEEFVKKL